MEVGLRIVIFDEELLTALGNLIRLVIELRLYLLIIVIDMRGLLLVELVVSIFLVHRVVVIVVIEGLIILFGLDVFHHDHNFTLCLIFLNRRLVWICSLLIKRQQVS